VPPERAAPAAAPVGGWEALIGVTLGATGGGYSMDFRKDEFAYKQTFSGLVPHIMLSSALVLVLLLGLVARYQFGIRQYIAEKEQLKSQIEQLRQEVEAKQKEGVNVDSDFFTEPTFLDVLKEIAVRLPDEKATINDMRLDPVGENAPWIVLRGNVKDETDTGFKQAFEQLKQSKLFKVDDDAGLKMEEGKSTFRITVRKAGGAGAK
jgi:hypothetical protein